MVAGGVTGQSEHRSGHVRMNGKNTELFVLVVTLQTLESNDT
jgi:hypothetical protein